MVIDSIKSIIKYENRSKRMRTKLVCGFTLIEIIVVIGIMAVLTAIVYSSFDTSKAQSRDQQRVSDISVIQLALEQFFNKNGVYPVSINNNTDFTKYLSDVPRDPKTGESYSSNYLALSKASSDNAKKCISYHLWAKFEINNSYLNSKKSFDSTSGGLSSTKYFKCGTNIGNPNGGIDASASENNLIYDVMP